MPIQCPRALVFGHSQSTNGYGKCREPTCYDQLATLSVGGFLLPSAVPSFATLIIYLAICPFSCTILLVTNKRYLCTSVVVLNVCHKQYLCLFCVYVCSWVRGKIARTLSYGIKQTHVRRARTSHRWGTCSLAGIISYSGNFLLELRAGPTWLGWWGQANVTAMLWRMFITNELIKVLVEAVWLSDWKY